MSSFFSKHLFFFYRDFQKSFALFYEKPRVPLVAFSVFSVLAIVGVILVAKESEKSARNSRDRAYYNVAVPVAAQIRNALDQSAASVKSLVTYIQSVDDCNVIKDKFVNVSSNIMSFYTEVFRLEFDISDVVAINNSFVYPPLNNSFVNLKGCDLLDAYQTCYPINVSTELQYISRKKLWLSGPFHTDGYDILICYIYIHIRLLIFHSGIYGIFVIYPLWKSATSYTTDLGCHSSPTNCESFCWDDILKQKYFGNVVGLLDLGSIHHGFGLDALEHGNSEKYAYTLRVADDLDPTDYNYDLSSSVIYSRGTSLSDPVIAEVNFYNIKWIFEVSTELGWKPMWETPLIIGVIFTAFVVSLIILRLLIFSERFGRCIIFRFETIFRNHTLNFLFYSVQKYIPILF